MSSFILKIFAIITMTIDHVGLALFNNNTFFRIIGRIAMPIFAYQVAIGFNNTRSKLKYILRMFFVAFISEFSFDLLLKSAGYATTNFNICFTFTLALLTLYFIDLSRKNKLYFLASLIPILRKFNVTSRLWYLRCITGFTVLFLGR